MTSIMGNMAVGRDGTRAVELTPDLQAQGKETQRERKRSRENTNWKWHGLLKSQTSIAIQHSLLHTFSACLSVLIGKHRQVSHCFYCPRSTELYILK